MDVQRLTKNEVYSPITQLALRQRSDPQRDGGVSDDFSGRPTVRHGALLAAISEAIVGMRREHYGRGAVHAKSYAIDDVIVVVTRENGLTPLERTIVDAGAPGRLIALREDFLHAMTGRFNETIEQLTGQKVLACLYEVSLEPDITIVSFVLDRPFGDLYLTQEREPEAPGRIVDARNAIGSDIHPGSQANQ